MSSLRVITSGRLGQVLVFQTHVVGGRVREEFTLRVRDGTQLPTGVADVDVAACQLLAGWYQTPSADDDLGFDDCSVVDDRADADEHAIANRAAVDDRAVADDHVVADLQRPAVGVVVAGVRNVQDGVVLDIRPVADRDRMHIAADDGARPDRDIITQRRVANHRGCWINENALAERGRFASKITYRCVHSGQNPIFLNDGSVSLIFMDILFASKRLMLIRMNISELLVNLFTCVFCRCAKSEK